MKIRRYLGYGCVSVNGFNNGHYIDDEPIECADYAEAERLCTEALQEYVGTDVKCEDQGQYELPIVEAVTGYFDDEGNEISETEFQVMNENEEAGSWRYVYVSAERQED